MVERNADVAQLVEHQLPKLRVAGSIPVVRFRWTRLANRKDHAAALATLMKVARQD
jgi:hypothetical protein